MKAFSRIMLLVLVMTLVFGSVRVAHARIYHPYGFDTHYRQIYCQPAEEADFTEHCRVPILMYHEIGEPFTEHTELFVDPDNFERQMEYLVEHDYNTVSMAELAAHWLESEPLPSNPIVITFDDGFLGNYTKAFPVMKKLELTATIYVVEELIGSERYLNDSMLSEMLEAGFELGHHTKTHRELSNIPVNELEAEVKCSRDRLEDRFDVCIDTIAYPYGSYNEAVLEAVSGADYATGVTIEEGFASEEQGMLTLNRIAVLRSDGLEGFSEKLESRNDNEVKVNYCGQKRGLVPGR